MNNVETRSLFNSADTETEVPVADVVTAVAENPAEITIEDVEHAVDAALPNAGSVSQAEDGQTEESFEQLTAERDRLEAKIKERQSVEKASVIAQIKTITESYNISTEELVLALGGLKSKRKGSKAKAKYADPVTGKTWAGRGNAPSWIKGKNFEDFRVKEEAA